VNLCMMFNPEQLTKFPIIELSAIVYHNYIGNPEPANYLSKHKVLNIFSSNDHEGFYFDPLSKVVHNCH